MKTHKHYAKRLLATALTATLLLSLPGSSYAADKLTRISDGSYRLFEEGSSIGGVLHRGVDVSHWQGEIDWQTAAQNDVDFVMLGTRYQGKEDPLFQQNARDAAAAGVKIGAYIYSYATTVEMAEQEADFVLNIVRDHPISYPIAFDAENADTLGSLPKDEISAIVHAFCKKISDAGYYPILYANDYWITNKLDMDALSQYPVWVAAYERPAKYKNPVMWQGTESGNIEGISGGVDIDLQFKDFSSVIPANSWKKFDNRWYYYQDYRMQKDTLIFDGSNSYFMNPDGTIYTGGWKELSGKKCYFDPGTGIMRLGWKQINGKWYYFATDGNMQTGWVSDAGFWYYMGGDGAMQTGVVNVNETLYYLGADGSMYHDTKVEYNGKTWWIDGGGAMSEYHEETAAEGTDAGNAGAAPGSAQTGGISADSAATGADKSSTTGTGSKASSDSSEEITHVEAKPTLEGDTSGAGSQGRVTPAGV